MRIVLALALGCAALLLTACGGDDETTTTATTTAATTGPTGPRDTSDPADGPTPDENATPSDKKEVSNVVAAVVGGGDPEKACSTSVTDAYVRSAYGDEQGCRAAVTEQGGFDLVVNRVQVSGETAEATAIALGGPNANEDLDVRLVLEEGQWKVDFLRSDAPAGP